jgi:nicotinamidase-related amidase
MKPAILLIDLQNDFLRSSSLEPAAGRVVGGATRLLNAGRKLSIPVVHVWTTVTLEEDRRMPHWKSMGKWACIQGTEGHATPEQLRPLSLEIVIHKTFFSAFSVDALDRILRSLEVNTLLLAGVHLHGCIRTTALDAYQRGFSVSIAEDAVASDDPLHAAISRRYLQKRGIRFVAVDSILSTFGEKTPRITGRTHSPRMLPAAVISGASAGSKGLESMIHVSPRETNERLWSVPVCGQELISRATRAAQDAWAEWRVTAIPFRIGILALTREADGCGNRQAGNTGPSGDGTHHCIAQNGNTSRK